MFGWDFNKGRSSVEGGILAFYGIAEYTGRGDHHGHFLLWLFGALNPTDLHEKLKSSPGFDLKVVSFFEGIIEHHLPNIEVKIDKEYEPRSERPLHAPPSPDSWEMFHLDELQVDFETEVKKCGESSSDMNAMLFAINMEMQIRVFFIILMILLNSLHLMQIQIL